MAPGALNQGRRRLLFSAAVASLCGGSAARIRTMPRREIAALAHLLKAGDVVFRTGLSLESRAVLEAAESAQFSHVGVVVRTAAGLRVEHAMPPEQGSPGGVVLSTWTEFALEADVVDAAVYRISELESDELARILLAAHAMLGRPFNSRFLAAAEDGALYCTQFAISALAAGDATALHFMHATQLTLLPDPVLLPDALLAWPRLRLVSAPVA